jgi:MFS transporter, MFS domain-containing protein family, molybdate-anion transporter
MKNMLSLLFCNHCRRNNKKSFQHIAVTTKATIIIISFLISFLHVFTIATAFAATTKTPAIHQQQQQQQRRTIHPHLPYHSSTINNLYYKINNNNHNNVYHHQSVQIPTKTTSATTTTTTSLSLLRGGGSGVEVEGALSVLSTSSTAVLSYLTNLVQFGTDTPQRLFNTVFASLLLSTIILKFLQRIQQQQQNNNGSGTTIGSASKKTPLHVMSLQRRFLSVFWLLRCSDWLQGPYFYEVYASKKVVLGSTSGIALISQLFLTGFASTALFGPIVGKAADDYGRKKATIAFTIIYAIGALSTKSSLLYLLFVGRIISGIGTSLLFSAPESWLVGEAQQKQIITVTTETGLNTELVVQKEVDCTEYLGDTFGLAYAGDSIVAILAGQMAGAAATKRGPTGPFELSTIFLAIGGLLTTLLWKENKAGDSIVNNNKTTNDDDTTATTAASSTNSRKTTKDAINICLKDPKIMLVGSVQSLFEAAMYIFVLQWPPAMSRAIQASFASTTLSTTTPYGTIFSCFMACCLLGSTLFGQLSKMKIPIEISTISFLAVATIAMSTSAWTVLQQTTSVLTLPLLVTSFFTFEAVVGMYFPSIGTLRSRFVPDSHRSLIMNLFGIPLNVLVVSVFLSINKLGVGGALTISSLALGLATLCMIRLQQIVGTSTTSSTSTTE